MDDRVRAALSDCYTIQRELGAGGMATVYLAHDRKHDRQVAIKVLRPELAQALGPERFLREITTTANLRHPHILPLYDSGEADSFLYYVMPFVEGESLRDRLDREKQMSIADALQIAGEVAEALSYAHSRGVIHRDIKPENILLEGGHAVVADFGIARAVTQAGADKLTQTGVAVGTPAYMSPEQSVGDDDVDARSDLYALGSVLYEMLAGEPPYFGSSAQALIAKRFREPVPRISTLRETVPASLEAALLRVLAKAPADRFASAGEFAAALTAPANSSPTRAAEGFWVAVLPIKVHGADPELTAFADGLGDDITTGLSRFSHLNVISSKPALQSAGQSLDVRTVGRELGARYVLEGAVRKAGVTMRVSVQLLDASTGAHLWAECYDRELGGSAIFAIQDDITDRVVATVADPYGVLVRSMAVAVRDRPLEDLTATELVLRFFAYWHQIRRDEHARLRTALEHRLEHEPLHANAWACLARLYSHEIEHQLNPLPDSVERARNTAQRAVEIDPTCQMAWESLADASFFARDLAGFRTAAERAMSLNPRNTNTMASMAVLMTMAGDRDRCVALARRAMALNPHHPGWYHAPVVVDHYLKKEYEEALQATKRMNMPELFWTHVLTVAACGRLGRADEARAALETWRSLFPDYRRELLLHMDAIGMDAQLREPLMQGLDEAEALAGGPTRLSSRIGWS